MNTQATDAVWNQKGATLSDKSARKEFGLTQEEIVAAIKHGKLHYRVNSVFGNPFLRLVRTEVEALVGKKYGSRYLKKQKIRKELAEVNKVLKTLKTQVSCLENRKAQLLERLNE
jgi:hypothetical protein